jgi:tRNA (cmo5U34)-methyltransferase
VFDDHVRASVPFYDAIQSLIAELADWLLPAGGLLADLGCSTGNTAAAILMRQHDRGLRVHLYDESVPMLAKARPMLEGLAPGRVAATIGRLPGEGLEHAGADLTVAAFLLQFLPWADRFRLLCMARAAAAETGALILAEKTRPADSRWAEIAAEVSHDVKESNGITAGEIRAKARSLRGVLLPGRLDYVMAQAEEAGWCSPEVLFRWHSWAVIGAFATP